MGTLTTLLSDQTTQRIGWVLVHFLWQGFAIMALAFYALNERQKRLDRASGIPVDDEMTIKIKVYAGNRAFHISMILWCIIFIFSDVFTNPRTMIGIGILGSAATYGICLLYSRLTPNFSHSNNQ